MTAEALTLFDLEPRRPMTTAERELAVIAFREAAAARGEPLPHRCQRKDCEYRT